MRPLPLLHPKPIDFLPSLQHAFLKMDSPVCLRMQRKAGVWESAHFFEALD